MTYQIVTLCQILECFPWHSLVFNQTQTLTRKPLSLAAFKTAYLFLALLFICNSHNSIGFPFFLDGVKKNLHDRNRDIWLYSQMEKELEAESLHTGNCLSVEGNLGNWRTIWPFYKSKYSKTHSSVWFDLHANETIFYRPRYMIMLILEHQELCDCGFHSNRRDIPSQSNISFIFKHINKETVTRICVQRGVFTMAKSECKMPSSPCEPNEVHG